MEWRNNNKKGTRERLNEFENVKQQILPIVNREERFLQRRKSTTSKRRAAEACVATTEETRALAVLSTHLTDTNINLGCRKVLWLFA